LSTLIPGIIFLDFNNSTNVFDLSDVFYSTVSENKITPETYFSISGAVNSNSLYLLLFSSLFSVSIVANFFPRVP